jgi:PhzF family phenazine biosynthesis protein
MTVLRYAAFTTDPAGGNPAGVVLDARGLDDAAMQAIATEVGYSETAFVDGTAVRYFSPKAEVPFCGHATVATAVALAERDGPGEFVFETKAGTVPVTVDEQLRATLTSVEPYVEDAEPGEVLDILGWQPDELDADLPIRVAYAGARHLVIAAKTRERLARLDYDFARLTDYMTARDLTTLQLVWRESPTVYHVRDPFPVGGVVEDPATGAAAAAFGAYLRGQGLQVPAQLTLHQGCDLGRPSLIHVELHATDNRVRVTGNAVPIT